MTEPVSPWPFAGMIGMACALFLYGASGLFAPWWVVVLLVVVWLALLFVAVAWWSVRPTWVPAVAVVALLVWVATVALASL